MNELQKLKDFPTTEAEITEFIEQVKGQIQVRESLPVLAKLTALEKIVKEVKDAMKDQLLNEAGYEGAKTFTDGGVKYELASRKTYSYKHCPAWQHLNDQQKEIEKTMKVIDNELVDPDTGEVIPPAHWTATDYIKVTLPKS